MNAASGLESSRSKNSVRAFAFRFADDFNTSDQSLLQTVANWA